MIVTILLLEDDQQLSDTVKQYLEYQGYEVLCAYDGLREQDKVYEKPHTFYTDLPGVIIFTFFYCFLDILPLPKTSSS